MAGKDNKIGFKIATDVTDLKSGIKSIKEEISKANKDFEKATVGLDKWSTSSEGLNAKLTQLNSKLDSQNKAVKAYQDEIERVSKLEGDHTVELALLNEKLHDAELAVKKTEKEIRHYSKSKENVIKLEKEQETELGKLTKIISEQESELKDLQTEYKNAVITYGENSDEVKTLAGSIEKLNDEIDDNKSKVNTAQDSLLNLGKAVDEPKNKYDSLTDEIKDQKEQLVKLQDEYKDAVVTYGKNSKEAKSLKGDIEKLSDELEDNQKEVQYADKQLELLDKQFEETADSAEQFTKGLDGIKGLGSKVAGGLATLTAGIGALAGAFLATGEATKEYRTNMGKIETGFETSGLKAEQARETYKNLWSVVADDGKATEATAMLSQLATSQEDLNKWTNILTGVYATFGDSLPIENLAEASLETSKTGKITGGLADALNWCGISEEAFQESLDRCTTEQERQKLITETLNATYDEASKKYQQVNKDVIDSNKAQVNLTETMAKLGEKAEPILTVVKDGFNQLLQEVLKLTENVDFEALAEKIKGGFAYFIDTIIPAIKDGFQWILDNKDILIAGIVAIGTGMLAWNVVSIVQGVVGAIKAWTIATEGMTVAQRLLNLAMSANPIGLIITLVSALVAGFVVLWNTSDSFRQFWIDLWEKLKTAVGTVVDWIKENWDTLVLFMMNPFVGLFKYLYENFEGFRTTVDTVLNKVVQFFKDCWANIKSAWSGVSTWFSDTASKVSDAFKNIPSKIKEFFSNAWAKAKEAWSTVTTFFSDTKDKVIDAFIELPADMLDVGKNLVEGLWDGVKDKTDWVIKKLQSFGEDVLGGIKKFFGIKSPSKVFRQLGKWLGEGLGLGIEDKSEYATDKAVNMAENIVDSTAEAIAMGERKLDKAWSDLMGAINSGASATEINMLQKVYDNAFNELEKLKNQKTNDIVIDVKVKEESTDLFENLIQGIGEGLGKSDDVLDEFVKKTKERVSNIANTIGNVGTQIFDLINDSLKHSMDVIDSENQAFIKSKNQELLKQQQLYEQGILGEEEFSKIKKQIEAEKQKAEEETLKKKNELAKKQFLAQKVNDIAQATINGTQAIMKGFADLGPVAGAINAGIQAGITATQIGTIASQKFIPYLAKGGVVDNPTLAMIGEAGKEVVMPLENNTGWISELAEKLSAIMQKDLSLGLNQPQLAYAGQPVVNNYNNYNQTINSPKQLSRREIYRDSKNLLSLKGR